LIRFRSHSLCLQIPAQFLAPVLVKTLHGAKHSSRTAGFEVAGNKHRCALRVVALFERLKLELGEKSLSRSSPASSGFERDFLGSWCSSRPKLRRNRYCPGAGSLRVGWIGQHEHGTDAPHGSLLAIGRLAPQWATPPATGTSLWSRLRITWCVQFQCPLSIGGWLSRQARDESGEAARSHPAWAMLTPLGFTSSPR
jgi:hypothetical protein